MRLPVASRTTSSAARSGARRIRGGMRVLVRMANQERATYIGALHPSLWRRGFYSYRKYCYPGIEDPSLPFISDVRDQLFTRRLNTRPARALVHDKQRFAGELDARGLASSAPAVYGVITAGGLRVRSAEAGDLLRLQDQVVVKPLARAGGAGVRLVPAREVAAMAVPAGEELLVQEQVRQHPALARINPGSLNTVRLLAVRVAPGECLLAAAAHRWGTQASQPVDNVTCGGLVSSVDLETGRLGPATGKPRERRRVLVDRHPDSGEQITGVVVPQWQAVRRLALRLMDVFPELDHVGWDLAVSDRGPLVIEGNGYMPGPIFQFHGPFVHDPRLRDYYVRHRLLPAGT